jgi:hypothetical protein
MLAISVSCPKILHMRLLSYSINAQTYEAFRSRTANVPLWCSRRTQILEALCDAVRKALGTSFCDAIVQSFYHREHGAIRLDCPVWTDPLTFNRFLIGIGMVLGGQPIVQPGQHDVTRHNELSHHSPEQVQTSIRSAYRHDPLHTDGHGFQSLTMDYLAIGCVERRGCSFESAHTKLLHVDDWPEYDVYATSELGKTPFSVAYWKWNKRPQSLQCLADLEGNPEVSVRQEKLFFRHPFFGKGISFLCGHIVPTNVAEKGFLQEVQQSIENTDCQTRFALLPGQILLLNNVFWLHGRTPIEPNQTLFRKLVSVHFHYSFHRSS